MNSAKELVISIKSLFNKQGTEDAEKALDKVGQKAEAAGKKTEEAAKRGGKEMDEGAKKAHGLGGAIKGMSEKAELFGKVMRGLGVVGIVSLIAEGVQRVVEKLNESKTAAEQLNIKADFEEHAKSVESLADAYEKLKNLITDSANEIQKLNEISELSKGGSRAIEDAKSQLSEAEEISRLDPSDPERSQKESSIRARYARQRAMSSVTRKTEDIEAQRSQLEKSAQQSELSAADLEKKAEKIKNQQKYEASRGLELDWRSKTSRIYKWDLFGGRLEETPLSQDYAKYAEASRSNSEKLSKMAEDAQRQAKLLRDEAAQSRAKSKALAPLLDAGAIELSAEDKAGVSSIADADYSLKSAQEKRAEEEKTKQKEALKKASDLNRLDVTVSELEGRREELEVQRATLSSNAQIAALAQSRNIPGITRSNGRLVRQSDVDAAAERAAQAAESFSASLPAQFDRIAKALANAKSQIKNLRESD